MNQVEFRCANCGSKRTENVLSTKHSVLGSLPLINRKAGCCGNPEYRDLEGYHHARQDLSIRNLIPVG